MYVEAIIRNMGAGIASRLSSPLLLVNCFPTPVVVIHVHGQLELSSPHP